MIKYTELKNFNRKVLREVIPLPKPFTLLIEPSSLCNFKCKMCFQSAKNKGDFKNKRSNMTMDCFSKVVEQSKYWGLDKFKVLKLSLYGEPFMNPNFLDMLKLAKKESIAERIETTSNGSLLNEYICENLVKFNLDYIRISIYSPIPKKHTEITNSDIGVRKIYENIKMLRKIRNEMKSKKPFIAVKMLNTFSDDNIIFEELYNDIADEVYLDEPHNWVQPYDETFIDKLYGKVPKVSREKRVTCTMPFTTLAVRSNGDVSPCCVDWYGGTNIGNIYIKTLKEIWDGDDLYNMRVLQLTNRQHENISCKNCEIYMNTFYSRDNIDGFPVEKLR